jgi:hypothetical protein
VQNVTDIIYNLPESWACAILNDDYTGFDDNEEEMIKDFFDCELKDNQYLVLHSEESEFMYYHDARDYGWGGDNCLEFMLMEV